MKKRIITWLLLMVILVSTISLSNAADLMNPDYKIDTFYIEEEPQDRFFPCFAWKLAYTFAQDRSVQISIIVTDSKGNTYNHTFEQIIDSNQSSVFFTADINEFITKGKDETALEKLRKSFAGLNSIELAVDGISADKREWLISLKYNKQESSSKPKETNTTGNDDSKTTPKPTISKDDPVITAVPASPTKRPKSACPKCHTRGEVTCSQCGGSGGSWKTTHSAIGGKTGRKWENCFKCKGKTTVSCTYCGGDGWIND